MDGPSLIAPETIVALTHDVAEAIVTWVYPDRTDEFHELWPSLSGYLKSIRTGSAASSVLLGGIRASPLWEPAGTGAHVAILVAWAALQECGRHSVLPPLDEIRGGVESCAIRFGVDASVASRIAAAAAPALFDLLAALPPAPTMSADGSAPSDLQPQSDRLVAVWSEHWADCETDPVFAIPSTTAGSRSEILSRFEPRRHEFTLYVNEVGPLLYRCVSDRARAPSQLQWIELEAQLRRFLWLVLSAFETGQAIDYRTIGRYVFERRPPTRDKVPDASIRRVKSELNRKLDGLIDYAIRAEPGGKRYVLAHQFPFCWIRTPCGPSRLYA